ncbi:DUF3604 domain-containing protein [Pseudohalioglobus lutimaris]|uniref:DUF3604 domain-containing protein n=1 Tax=Pseudohalioglobus lutimaris TaxID=1737061 RepID=A0A2N5X6N1_9GAMM|nr:DUF3604 domain-containing protein [Pseudohalioglobus lutimaris]PLW70138.1 hypothetical protein C0039_02710 [Pseudohalioglobus lutimaris]
MNITIKRAAKALLWFLLLLLLAALLSFFWLRHEFARVQSAGMQSEYWRNVPVQSLEPGLTAPRPCHQTPHTRAFFGALHVHTGASYDASAFGITVSVDDAYRFARGTTLPLRLRADPEGFGAPVQTISTPLDFMAVTDHAESLGEARLCYTPGSRPYGTLVCRLYRGDVRLPVAADTQPIMRLATLAIFGKDRSARVCGKDGSLCRERAADTWQDNQRSTERWHDRSEECDFTTLHAYEYTLAEASSNLHRNVIFRSAVVPQAPLGSKDAQTPEALWQWLKQTCIDGNPQCDVLAIPHNGNWSSGRMWYPYSNRDLSDRTRRQQAELRAELEPLAEIMQTKGDSECRNGIDSVLGPADEFCDFEKLRAASEPIEDCEESFGSGGMMLSGCTSRYNFVRYALAAGLRERRELGVNPFAMGIIAATDTHNGMPAADSESQYMGSHGMDRNVLSRLQGTKEVPGGIGKGSPVRYGPGGVAGIYARENSRDALFDAMRRRETFGTSGPRIEPRFFAGWELDQVDCQSPDFVEQAGRLGVPMGAALYSHDDSADPLGPVFLASATRDPRDGAGLLQRIQVIKSWVDSAGATHQAVHDIAGDPNNGAGVDPETCALSGSGFNQLCATWRDPDFDAALSAVYYARVLENPSCRWSRHACIRLPEAGRAPSCGDPDLPWQIQERAWTSPIWYYAD